MAGLVQMMSAPVRIGVQNELQDLRLAVNVAQYDTLDLLLNVYEGSNVAIQIWTGMQVESDEGGDRWRSSRGGSRAGLSSVKSC